MRKLIPLALVLSNMLQPVSARAEEPRLTKEMCVSMVQLGTRAYREAWFDTWESQNLGKLAKTLDYFFDVMDDQARALVRAYATGVGSSQLVHARLDPDFDQQVAWPMETLSALRMKLVVANRKILMVDSASPDIALPLHEIVADRSVLVKKLHDLRVKRVSAALGARRGERYGTAREYLEKHEHVPAYCFSSSFRAELEMSADPLDKNDSAIAILDAASSRSTGASGAE